MDLDSYLNQVWEEGRLDDELIRVQNLLLEATKVPYPDPANQTRRVWILTQAFRGLLLTKDAREKAIQQIRQNDRRSAQDSRTRPAHDPTRGIGVWNILKQKVAWR